MKTRWLFWISVCLLLPFLGRAESLSGRVLSSASGEAIPYVNIGVLKGERGTVSNDKGYFRLDLSEIDEESTLRFSFIGYESYDVTIAEILERCNVSCEIELTPKTLELPEVVVYPRKFKEKVVGNPHPPPGLKAGFTNDSLGYELGILVKLKHRPTHLKELRLHGIETSFDTIFYRLNVYEMDQDLPGKNVLSEPIYVTLTSFSGEKIIKIDLSRHHIVVEDDFVISLEYVKELGEGNLVFATGILSGKMFYRKTSQAEWHSAPFGLGMSVLISYEK